MGILIPVTGDRKIITDSVVLSTLANSGIDSKNVDFKYDYSKDFPYTKMYQDNSTGNHIIVSQGLPMARVDDGSLCIPGWVQSGKVFYAKNNFFECRIENNSIAMSCHTDQESGLLANKEIVYTPHLFAGSEELIPKSSPYILVNDPLNENYTDNVLDVDYGICTRRLRIIEGRLQGLWIFESNPKSDITIVYDNLGTFALSLGNYAVDDKTEFIPASVFDSAQYPFFIDDTYTYYPGTGAIDGYTRRYGATLGESWTQIRTGAGTEKFDSPISYDAMIAVYTYNTGSNFNMNVRSVFLFDTSGLPDDAIITSGTLSLRGKEKYNNVGNNLAIGMVTSNPTSSSALATGDYAYTKFGTTYFGNCSYSSWSVSGYNNITLDANGIANISKTGISKFGGNHYYEGQDGVAPSGNANSADGLWGYYAGAGDGYKPKLVIITALPAPKFTNTYRQRRV